MGLRVRPRLALFLATTVFLAGCGGDDNTLFPGEDGSAEAGPDGTGGNEGDGSMGGHDATGPESGPETGPGMDAGHDAGGVDATPPTDGSGSGDTGLGDGSDGAAEAGPQDGGVDANDAGHEVDASDGGGLDATSDAGHEPDASDAGLGTDAQGDSGSDAATGDGGGEDGSSGGGGDGGTIDAGDAGDSGGAPDATIDGSADAGIVNYISGVTVSTLAGSATGGELDGTGTAAEFLNPTGVAFDANGDLIVVDYDGNAVRRVALATGAVTTVAKAARFAGPFALVFAYDGSLYVETDFNPQGMKNTTSGTIWLVSPSADGGVVTPTVVATGFGRPRGLAPLTGADIFFSDRTNSVVQELDVSTKMASPLAGDPAQAGFQDGTGTGAHFASPVGAGVLPNGDYVVADRDNNRVRQVTTAGVVTTLAGNGVATTNDGSNPLGASFSAPQAIAVDAAGDVFVSDTGDHRIRRILANGTVETVAGNGTAGFQDGAGSTAQFYGAEGLAVTTDGKTLYVADGNMGTGAPYNRLRVITIP